MATLNTKIVLRNDTAANWTLHNPTLLEGEMGVETDTGLIKVGKEGERSTIFGDVVVRVSPSYAGAMHIDTDEANASCAFGQVMGTVIV